MASEPIPQEIRDILVQQREIARSLIHLLDREFAALSGNDLQGIEKTLADKQQVMDRLEGLSRELMAKTKQDSPGKRDRIVTILRHLDPRQTWGLETLWQQTSELISQCRHKNGTNGKIISLNHRHIQQALEILRHGGQSSQACYSPAGTRQTPVSSRILGKV